MAELQIDLDRTDLHLISLDRLNNWIVQVVEVEGPVHWLEATRRVASCAGVQRVGSRIQEAFKRACRLGSKKKLYHYKDEFLTKVDAGALVIRDRSDFSPQLKKLEYVAPEEIQAAIEFSIRDGFGLDLSDVAVSSCRLLGFARVTEECGRLWKRNGTE
jgi:hypothetical protein